MHRTAHAVLPPALTAFLAGRPVEPIGYVGGRAVFPIAGGAPDDDPDKGDGKDKNKDGDDFKPITSQEEFDRRLGPRLERERAKFGDYDDLKDKAQKFDEHVEQSRSEQEKAVEAARKEGEATATTAARGRLIAAEARVVAAEAKFRSPASAVKLLDLSTVKVGDDGEPDREAIKAKLDELAEKEPWQVDTGEDGKGKRPKPDPTQGGKGNQHRGGSVAEVMEQRRAAREAKTTSSRS